MKNLNVLFKLVKPSTNILNKDSRFLQMADHEGWTDTYIADLTSKNVELMKAAATVKGCQMPEAKPNITPVLDRAGIEEHEVAEVSVDLSTGIPTAKLHNSEITANVNPKYLAYFQAAYKELGGIDRLTLTGSFSPVGVYSAGTLVGVIMPIKA